MWEGWTEWASSDEATIRSWWGSQEFNIGVLTTDLVVVDIDMKHDRDGMASWFALYGGFDTLAVRSPSGGLHLYYTGANVALNQGALGAGLDIRSHHGYVLGPGSTIDGVPYRVEIDQPMAQAPHEVVSRCKPPGERAANAQETLVDEDDARGIALAVQVIAATLPAVEGERSEAAYRLACKVRDFGVSEVMCRSLMAAWGASSNVVGDDLHTRIANAYSYAQNPAGSKHPDVLFSGIVVPPAPDLPPGSGPSPVADARPVVKLAAGVDVIATLAEDALMLSRLPVFQRGASLVRPVVQDVAASHGRKVPAAGLQQLDAYSLTDLLSQAAIWTKFDGRKKEEVRTDPPQPVAKTVLSRQGHWRLPVISGVITTPTLRPDGTVLVAPGYDEVTRLYHAADPSLSLPGDAPIDRAAAEKALADLDGLLGGFPFVSPVSRAVALSALISPVVRGALSAVPLHVFRASTAGTGKSYLADVASTIATGRPCPVMAAAAGRGDEENEKRLVSFLLDGTPIISIDNVNGELGGDLLCQAVERPLVRVRRLGLSGLVEIENRATLFATGNNLRVRGDMTRRTLICDLDAQVERPELRAFQFDPVQRVLLDRARYVVACLTIARAYLAAGMPAPRPPVASFADWSRLVRSPLVWLGCADPADAMETAREDDPELSEHREMLTAWTEHLGAGSFTVRDAIQQAFGRRPLEDAMRTVAGDPGGGVNPKRLGRWLAAHQGRIVDGLAFRRTGGEAHGGLTRWRCERHGT